LSPVNTDGVVILAILLVLTVYWVLSECFALAELSETEPDLKSWNVFDVETVQLLKLLN